MRGLIAYMGWLTKEFRKRKPDCKDSSCTPKGFPSFTPGDGNYEEGQRIYTQKCSFCHDAEGQGRYESDTYFRPAL